MLDEPPLGIGRAAAGLAPEDQQAEGEERGLGGEILGPPVVGVVVVHHHRQLLRGVGLAGEGGEEGGQVLAAVAEGRGDDDVVPARAVHARLQVHVRDAEVVVGMLLLLLLLLLLLPLGLVVGKGLDRVRHGLARGRRGGGGAEACAAAAAAVAAEAVCTVAAVHGAGGMQAEKEEAGGEHLEEQEGLEAAAPAVAAAVMVAAALGCGGGRHRS